MLLKESSILDTISAAKSEFCLTEEVELDKDIQTLIELRTRAEISLQEFSAMCLYDSGSPLRFSDTQQKVELQGSSKDQLIKVLIKALQAEIKEYDTQIENWLNEDVYFDEEKILCG